jgi:hypothetical protein
MLMLSKRNRMLVCLALVLASFILAVVLYNNNELLLKDDKENKKLQENTNITISLMATTGALLLIKLVYLYMRRKELFN